MIKKKFLAVILARGGSKGIPKKNIYLINNHPLISYSLEAAKNVKLIDKIVVSSDSEEILEISKKYGADEIIRRPKYLSNDRATSADALHHAVLESEIKFGYKFDYIIELPCVSPLRDHEDINSVINILKTNKYDSVISYVDTGEKHPIRLKRIKNKKVSNFCKDYKEARWGSIRQDFEPCFIRNGAIYSMKRSCIIDYKSRWGIKSYPYIMSPQKSINIDTYFDLLQAKLMIENGYCKNLPKIKYTNKIHNSVKKNYNLLVTTPTHILNGFDNEIIKKFNYHYIHFSKFDDIKEKLSTTDYWICNPSPNYLIGSKILKKAKNLKAIFTPSTGTTHIDLDYLKKNKIKLFSIRESNKIKNIKASSEFAFGLILDSQRNLSKGVKMSKNGFWRGQEDYLRGNQLYKKKLGVIGYGRIGSNVSKFSRAFGIQITSYDPYKIEYLKKKKIYSTLDKLIKTSDIILISVHLNEKTKNLVDKKFLKKMKKNASLINVSRGEIINEKDLLNCLKKKLIKSAHVDVIRNEQEIDLCDHKMIEYSRHNDNLIITPHMAGLTHESENIAAKIILDQLKNVEKKR